MKKVLQLVVILLIAQGSVNAQWMMDSITMGPGYSNNIFYGFGSGVQKTEPSSNWHLSFTMNALADSGAVFANHQAGNEYVKVWNIHRPMSDWNSVGLADTATGDVLLAPYAGWYDGTFNQISNPSAFNFGWGTYNISTHNIYGDSLFIVRAGGDYYILGLDSVNGFSSNWNFRTQKLDLIGMTQSHSVLSSTYPDRLFAYFDITTGQFLDREPDVNSWDLEFITYPSYVQAGPGTGWYAVSGVLSNRGLPVAEARQLHVDTAEQEFVNGTGSWGTGWENNEITTIGYDWKDFNSTTFTFDIEDSLSYFVRAQDGKAYQLQFLDFEGSASGKAVFRYREVQFPVAVNDIQSFTKPSVFPNPAQNEVNILVNATVSTSAQLIITNLNGQVIYNAPKKLSLGLNAWTFDASQLPAGNYVISISNVEGATHQKLTITK